MVGRMVMEKVKVEVKDKKRVQFWLKGGSVAGGAVSGASVTEGGGWVKSPL